MPDGPVVLFGGGTLGAAVARLASSAGRPVVVASRTPRGHPGWWRRWRAGEAEHLAWLPPRATVIVALGPGPRESAEPAWGRGLAALLGRLLTYRPARVLVCGPARGDEPSIATFEGTVRAQPVDALRLPPLFGVGDGPVASAAAALRAQKPISVGELPAVRWLCADDAARVALTLEAGVGEVEVSGPQPLRPAEVAALLVARFGGRCRAPLWGTGIAAAPAARLVAWSSLPDQWSERWGERTALDAWVERLPGPRRRPGALATGPDSAATG